MIDKQSIIERLLGDITIPQREGEFISVALLKTEQKGEFNETLDINTAIIPDALVDKINPSYLNPFVERSGINYKADYKYKPEFWLHVSKASGLSKAEPLCVSWCSGNHTTLCIDQGFLSAFDLSPRILDNVIIWDDLRKPFFEVVKNKLLSEYKFPIHTEAYVKVNKEYLKKYLDARKKIAVQIFTITKDTLLNDNILFLLSNKDSCIHKVGQFEIRIRKIDHKENEAHIEIKGFKILFREEQEFLDSNPQSGHYWKGIEGLVTPWRARHELSFRNVYVSDKVLSKFEGDDNYDVYPLSGSVHYGNHWAVSYCRRVGRNAIEIELKKLYEGNRFEIINYWNQFSIQKSEIIEGENIASKAERLSKSFFLLGRQLSKVFNKLFECSYTPMDIISVDEIYSANNGWSTFSEFHMIACHIDLNSFSKEQFLARCKKLYILLCENLRESAFRKVVEYIKFPTLDTKTFRSLKLLELIFKYLYVVQNSGLDVLADKIEIAERVVEVSKFNLMSKLFALNHMRQLDAHRGNNTKLKLHAALKEFGIEPNSIVNNYADCSFGIYDSLIATLDDMNNILANFTLANIDPYK